MNDYSKILIAEDDAEGYDFFVEALEKIDGKFDITRAKNGLECMRFLKEGLKPDLIFLDLKMPGFNGLDCLKFIKAKADIADIPVIIYSASHYIKEIDACFKNEAHYYIVKPSSGDSLVYILSQVIDRISTSIERPFKSSFVVRVTAEIW
jgi:CheY-like chemotaxis protein